MSDLNEYGLFIAGSSGQIRAFNIKTNIWGQIHSTNQYNISSLYCDENNENIIIGKTNGEIYNLTTNKFITDSNETDDLLIGLCTYDSNLITCLKSGLISYSKSEVIRYNAGPNICCLRQNEFTRSVIATGGEEKHLKLWDVCGDSVTPFFTAKNLKHDWLNLRIPTWITDIAFSDDNKTIFVASNYNKIDVYDIKAQRRPVLVINDGDNPITSISLLPNQREIITGNTLGFTSLFDTRGKGKLVHHYPKANGGISKVFCDGKFLAVSSMDRFFRIYDVKSKLLIYKLYLKTSPLNFLIRKDFDFSGILNSMNKKVDIISEKRYMTSEERISADSDDYIIRKRLKNF